MRRFTLALALFAGTTICGPLHAAPPVVELTELPDRLQLPLPAGTNRLFAVKVAGTPDAVWMATGAEADARLPLQPMGGRWVFNLGDPQVAKVIAGGTQFQIFARASGETGASLPVQFVAARKATVSLELRDEKGVRLPASGWVDTARVSTIELQWQGTGIRAPVVLSAGEARMVVEPDDGAVSVKPDDALRRGWRARGTLELIDGDGRIRSTLRAVPGALDAAAHQTLRIVQRHRREVPGSGGYLTVRLGDISGTRVPVTLTGADGTVFFEQRLLAQGDRAEFALGGGERRYALVVDKLVNMMIGDDHAELRFEPAGAGLTK